MLINQNQVVEIYRPRYAVKAGLMAAVIPLLKVGLELRDERFYLGSDEELIAGSLVLTTEDAPFIIEMVLYDKPIMPFEHGDRYLWWRLPGMDFPPCGNRRGERFSLREISEYHSGSEILRQFSSPLYDIVHWIETTKKVIVRCTSLSQCGAGLLLAVVAQIYDLSNRGVLTLGACYAIKGLAEDKFWSPV